MVNVTVAHGKVEIRILHSQAVGNNVAHGKLQIQFFQRERAKVNVAHGKINVYLMQDIFRSCNGEHSTVNIKESVVFQDMVGKLCGSVFLLEWVRYRVLKPSNCSVISETFGSTTKRMLP